MPEFARRTRLRGGDELTTILAGSPPGVLSMTGGFPNPSTFPEVGELAARLVKEDAAVALQYTPCEGLPSVREYLIDRQEQLHGRRPDRSELIVTSGGMECIALMCQALIDPGDTVAVEAPTYLGALMAFAGAEAELTAIPTDEDGLIVDALAERLAAGAKPKFLYTIPEYQNPTGRTLPLDRRRALVELCRRHDVLIFEDVAYRELSFDGTSLPSLWSLAPDVVLQAGTFSKSFFPGVRLGWAAGPADVVAELAAAKQNTDQCAGGLGQRLVEEYGRAGGFERHLPAARALYASHWAALSDALAPPHARRRRVDRAAGRLPDLAHAAAGARHARAAPGRARGRRRLRPRPAVPRRRRPVATRSASRSATSPSPSSRPPPSGSPASSLSAASSSARAAPAPARSRAARGTSRTPARASRRR